jgi:acyl-CoA synthetase (AMP-forming)/AMP-acid ligase II
LLQQSLINPAQLTTSPESEHSLALDDTVLHFDADDPENKITKTQLSTLTQNIAHGLRHKYGIGKNGPNTDTVTVITHGQVLVPALLYGIIAAGGVYSSASPSSTISELARQVKIGKSNLIVCGAEHRDVAAGAANECGLPTENVLLLDSTKGFWKLSSLSGNVDALSRSKLKWRQIFDPVKLKSSLIVILWSSGTTGLPKGVMISHANLVAETYLTSLSGREWAAKEIEKGHSLPASELTTIAHLPISHIAGLFGYLIAPIYTGATVIWMGKYNWNDLLKHLKRYKVTSFYTVPSIWLRISKSPDITDHLSNLEAAATGAAPMDSVLQQAANKRIGDGKRIFVGQTYGLTETTGAVTAIPTGETDLTGCIGFILPSVELRMVDEMLQDVEPGQEGELLIRSPLVTNGYYDNPEATKAAFHGDWFCSGDIAVMRDGKFYIVDRKKVSRSAVLVPHARCEVADSEDRNCSNTKAYKSPLLKSRIFSSRTHRFERPLSSVCPRRMIRPQTGPERMSCLSILPPPPRSASRR